MTDALCSEWRRGNKHRKPDDETHMLEFFMSVEAYTSKQADETLTVSASLLLTGRKTVCFQNIFSYKHFTDKARR